MKKFFIKKLTEFLDENPEYFINIKCIPQFLSILFYDTMKFLFDFKIPYQNLLIKSFLGNSYLYQLIDFCAFILKYKFYYVSISSSQEKCNNNLYSLFKDKLYESIIPSVINNEKTILVIKFDVKMGQNLISKDEQIYKQIVEIYEDLNAILTNSDLKFCVSKIFYKNLVDELKKGENFSYCNEINLCIIINQRILSNMKIVLIFENLIEPEKKNKTPNIFFELFTEYPQTFKKFKTKTMEEFLSQIPYFNFPKEISSKFSFEFKDEVKLKIYINFY